MNEPLSTWRGPLKVRCPTLEQLPPPPPGETGWPWTEDSHQLSTTRLDGSAWPRVSVITPSYNQGQFIEETIRSVLLQGYPDIEYMIIDGGSTDQSLEIIRKYAPWLAYHVSEPDRGQTHAINKGLLRATGEILAYINTDDCYLNGAIATAAHEFCARPAVGMVYGTAAIVNEHDRWTTWKARPFDLKMMFTVGNIVPQPAAFFSRCASKEVGYLSEEWELIMDYEFCIRVGAQFPTVCVPRTLAKFRTHPQSKSRLRFEETTQELIRFVQGFNPDHISMPDWQRIKPTVMSRIHYELALCYVAQGHQAASKGFRQFLESLSLDPLFAVRHPILTAHIMKRVLTGRFMTIGGQIAAS
jgi:Glycosyltransferases involved in cell wall biogenesis